MSKELVCPFCGQELQEDVGYDGDYSCPNCREPYFGSPELWQELIRTRKALDLAISALTVIGEGCVIEHSVVGHEDDNKIKVAKIVLDKIKTELEKKDI